MIRELVVGRPDAAVPPHTAAFPVETTTRMGLPGSLVRLARRHWTWLLAVRVASDAELLVGSHAPAWAVAVISRRRRRLGRTEARWAP